MMLDTAAAFDAARAAQRRRRGAGRADPRQPLLPQHRRLAERHPGVHGGRDAAPVCTPTTASTSSSSTRRRAATPSTSSRRPGVLARFLDHRLFKLLMLPARRGMRVVNVATQPVLRTIGKVVGSDVLADAVAFFQAFAGMESGFRQRADGVIGLLRSDATRYVVVASPHRDTVDEAAWFAGQLARRASQHVGRRRQPRPAARSVPAPRPRPASRTRPPRRTATAGRRRAVAQPRRVAGAGRVRARRARAVRRAARRAARSPRCRCSPATCTTSTTLAEIRRYLFPDRRGQSRRESPLLATEPRRKVTFRRARAPRRRRRLAHRRRRRRARRSRDVVHGRAGGPRRGQGRRRPRRRGEPSTSASSTSRSARWAAWP